MTDMKCEECGARVQSFSSFCRQCGGRNLIWTDRDDDDDRHHRKGRPERVTLSIELSTGALLELVDEIEERR
jgi:hypothetical protein